MADELAEEILDLVVEFDRDWHGRASLTVRECLWHICDQTVFNGARFNAKRPFGDSSFFTHVQKAMIKAGHIRGVLDADGYVEHIPDAEELRSEVLFSSALSSALGVPRG